MASIRRNTWADGATTTFQVMWREDGRQTSATFDDEHTAGLFRLYLEADGPDAAYAWLEEYEGRDADAEEMPTLDKWADHYVTHLTGITDGTRAEYRRLYARTWSPLLGEHPVDAISRDTVAGAVNQLAKRLSASSIANAHSLLSAALEAAVTAKHIDKNPAHKLRLPRTDDRDDEHICFLTPTEFDAFYRQLPTYWQPLVATLAGTGMRWGEATALRVRDVTIDSPTPAARVTRAWKKGPTGPEIGPPKTRRSRRTVALPPELVGLLEPLAAGRKADDLLFVSTAGSRVDVGNFRQRVWVPAIQRAQQCDTHRREALRAAKAARKTPETCGCEGTLTRTPRIHDLRHTHVAWLIATGVNLVTIQRRLGHESIQTTIDVYGDLMPDLQLQAAQAASQSLSALRALPSA